MSQGQGQDQSSGQDNSIDLVYLLCNSHATAIATLIRRDFGAEALGINAFLAMLSLLFLYAGTGDRVVAVYLVALVFCQVMHRIRTLRLIGRGEIIHSRYAGYPYVAMMLPFVRKVSTAKGIVEPMMCLIGGAMISSVSQNLGGFIMLGFLTFMIRNGIEREIVRKRLERMHDAEIEQKYIADRFKNPGSED